jgi:hypothetical protein
MAYYCIIKAVVSNKWVILGCIVEKINEVG